MPASAHDPHWWLRMSPEWYLRDLWPPIPPAAMEANRRALRRLREEVAHASAQQQDMPLTGRGGQDRG